jgi:hypothetical protein
VSSQRVRERRIDEKLRAGSLRLARPPDVPHPAPAGADPCHGCDEPETDSLVGEHAWHSLCVLFWQGRSEAIRGERFPGTPVDPGAPPARSRWVIVVRVDRPEVYSTLRRNYAGSPWVDVVVDRRRGERRQASGQVQGVNRRKGRGRRIADGDPARSPTFRLAHRGNGSEVYEAVGPETTGCPRCGATVSVELPRFVEPPVRLVLTVIHEGSPTDGAKHSVELQSFSATGRVLLATRLLGRSRIDPNRGGG